MNIELMKSFISKWAQSAGKNSFSSFVKVSLLLFFLITCWLLTMGSYVLLCVIAVLFAVGCFDLGVRTKKKGKTVYVAIEMGLLLMLYTSLFFDVTVVGFRTITGTFNASLGILLLVASIAFIFVGFFHTYFRLKKGKEEKFRPSSVASCLSAAMAGSALSGYLSENYTESVQELIYTAFFLLVVFCLMYFTGRIYVAMIYFIKKYNMPDKKIENLNT